MRFDFYREPLGGIQFQKQPADHTITETSYRYGRDEHLMGANSMYGSVLVPGGFGTWSSCAWIEARPGGREALCACVRRFLVAWSLPHVFRRWAASQA